MSFVATTDSKANSIRLTYVYLVVLGFTIIQTHSCFLFVSIAFSSHLLQFLS